MTLSLVNGFWTWDYSIWHVGTDLRKIMKPLMAGKIGKHKGHAVRLFSCKMNKLKWFSKMYFVSYWTYFLGSVFGFWIKDWRLNFYSNSYIVFGNNVTVLSFETWYLFRFKLQMVLKPFQPIEVWVRVLSAISALFLSKVLSVEVKVFCPPFHMILSRHWLVIDHLYIYAFESHTQFRKNVFLALLEFRIVWSECFLLEIL